MPEQNAHTAPRLSCEALTAVIEDGKQFLVTGHRSPDGDSIGSILGVGLILGALGKKATLYGPDPVPADFRFLAGADGVVTKIAADERFDACIVVDTADEKLLGPDFPDEARRGAVIVLDHHAVSRPFGDYRWCDPEAPATALIVAQLAACLGVELDAALAEPLWTGLYMDTGGFRYSSTSAAALRLAAELVDAGVNPWDITVQLKESQPEARIRLLGKVLETLTLSAGGRIAAITVTEAMLAAERADATMLDGFINYARSIKGVEVAIQLRQRGRHCRISLRSKGRVDVGALAGELGGGGHHNAAGCQLPGAPEQVRPKVLAKLEAALQLALSNDAEDPNS